MATRKRTAKKKAAQPSASKAKTMDVQVKEFQSAIAQLNDAMTKLGTIQLCVECSCGPCNECTVCRVCSTCRVCLVCRICKVCSVCFECSCGPCLAGS